MKKLLVLLFPLVLTLSGCKNNNPSWNPFDSKDEISIKDAKSLVKEWMSSLDSSASYSARRTYKRIEHYDSSDHVRESENDYYTGYYSISGTPGDEYYKVGYDFYRETSGATYYTNIGFGLIEVSNILNENYDYSRYVGRRPSDMHVYKKDVNLMFFCKYKEENDYQSYYLIMEMNKFGLCSFIQTVEQDEDSLGYYTTSVTKCTFQKL